MAKDYFAEEIGSTPKDYFSEEIGNATAKSSNIDLKPILSTALGAGGLYGASKLIAKSKVLPNIRRYALTDVLSVSKPTVSTIEREGFKKVSNINKQGIGNFVSDIIPKVEDKIISHVTSDKFDPSYLEEIGFTTDDIEYLKDIPKDKRGMFQNLKGKSLTSNLEDIAKIKEEAGGIIGRAEKIAKQTNTIEYIPKTHRMIKGYLNRLGYLKGNSLAQDISQVKDKALQGLLNEWKNSIRIDPNYPYEVSDIQKLRTNLEASLGGTAKNDRIIYQVLDTLRKEHAGNLNQVPAIQQLNINKANKDYSDSIKLEKASSKIKKVISSDPTKLIEKIKGATQDVMKEPTRQKLRKLLGKNLYSELESALATAEVYPLKQERIGPWQALYKGTSRGLLRTMKGAERVGKAGSKALSVVPFLTDTMKLKIDPEAYDISTSTGEDFWKIHQNLAPAGSEERKIQLKQLT